MKEKLFTKIIVSICLLPIYIGAQPPWLTTGNVTFLTDFLGSTNVMPLNFHTANLPRAQITSLAFGAQLQPYLGALTNPLPGNQMSRMRINYDGSVPPTQPASLLHIGTNDPGPWASGVRSWMNIGSMHLAGTDHLFVGFREKDNVLDPTGRTSVVTANPLLEKDVVITWGDNYRPTHPINGAQTNLCFLFLSHLGQWTPEPQSSDYGLEVMRLNGQGRVGIGPAFDDVSEPQNMLHINNSGTAQVYFQVSNRTGTGQGPNDGLHFGITTTGVGEIIQKENQDLRIYTSNIQRAVFAASGDVGLNTNTPGNKLEISSSSGNPYFTGPNGSSGLRFTNLTSASTPFGSIPGGTGPVTAFLTVDTNGDVILASQGTGGIGNFCSASVPNPLTSDYEIPLNGAHYYFSGDASLTNKVNIGYPCGSPINSLQGKLNVMTSFPSNNSGSGSFGIYSEDNSSTSAFNYGLFSLAYNGLDNNYGVGGFAGGDGGRSYGGIFFASGASVANIGVYGYAQPLSGGTMTAPSYPLFSSIALFGRAATVGASNDFAGYFDGDVFINGPTNGTGWALVSDQMFKTNIDTIGNALQLIRQLKPRSFYMDTNNVFGLYFSGKKQYGLIAQQVATVVPELVNTVTKPAMSDSLGNIVTPGVSYKTLNYDGFTAIIIRAIQQLSNQNRRQDSLIRLLVECCRRNSENDKTMQVSNGFNFNKLDVELTDQDFIVLSQNAPNPFAESCVIEYNIPVDFKVAQIVFNTTDSRILKAVDIRNKGRGQLSVFASDLSNGIYSYYLMVDGKIIDTKKLVKQ